MNHHALYRQVWQLFLMKRWKVSKISGALHAVGNANDQSRIINQSAIDHSVSSTESIPEEQVLEQWRINEINSKIERGLDEDET